MVLVVPALVVLEPSAPLLLPIEKLLPIMDWPAIGVKEPPFEDIKSIMV